MLNNITIQGRLARDPELKHTSGGHAVTSFTIACERNYQQNGEKITDWVTIVAWRNLAERICKYWSKGKEIVVTGSLESRKYTDKTGAQRTTWEVKASDAFFTNRERQEVQEFNQDTEYNFSQITDDADLPF